MNTPSDLENLSREELLALLRSTQMQLEKSEERVQIAEEGRQIAEEGRQIAEEGRQIAEDERQIVEERLQTAEHKLDVVIQLTADKLKILEEITTRADHRIIVADKVLSRDIDEQIETLFDELTEWINDAVSWRHQAFGKGQDIRQSEGKDPAQETEQKMENAASASEANGIAKAREVGRQAIRQMDKITRTFTKTVMEMSDEEKQVCGGAIDGIMSMQTPEEPKKKTPKTSPGRKKKDRVPDREEHNHSQEGGGHCRKCGSQNKVVDEQFKTRFIRTLTSFNKTCEVLAAISDIEICPECGQVHVPIGDTDVPVTPSRELSLDTMLDCAECVYMGIPLNRLAAAVKAEAELGHNTIERNLHDFVRIYLKPVYEHILDKAKNAKALLADGTPFDCLENQGKGACVNKREDNKPEDLTEGKSNYILSFCSVPLSDDVFSCYGFLPTRSYESIKKVLTEEFKFETLITDAFSGYEKLASEHKSALQHCLIHFRRYVIKALDPMGYVEEMLRMPETELKKFIREEFAEGSDHALLFSVFTAIGKIYAFEASVDLKAKDAKERLSAARVYERTLLDGIDEIMSVMVKRHMTQDPKNPERYKPKRGDPYSKLCSYWFNNHEHFRVYLNDPMIPPDSNLVEQSIRSLTVLRKNCYFKSSSEYMEDLCVIYTVFRTMARRGMSTPKHALRNYCRGLYSYCLDEGYTQAYREGKDLNKKILSWDMQKLSAGFNFEDHFRLLMTPAC